MSFARPPRQFFKGIEEFIFNMIGSLRIISGYKAPDILQILARFWRKYVIGHAYWFLARRRRARACSAGIPCSLSSCVKPRLIFCLTSAKFFCRIWSRSSKRRNVSRITSDAEVYRPLWTFSATNPSNAGVKDTFITSPSTKLKNALNNRNVNHRYYELHPLDLFRHLQHLGHLFPFLHGLFQLAAIADQ